MGIAAIGAVAGIASAGMGIAKDLGAFGSGGGGGYGGAVASGLGSAAGAYFQYKAAQKAAARLAPFTAAGTNVLPTLQSALGPGGATAFRGTPGFNFALQQGTDAIQNSAAARGGVVSGNTLKALDQFGTGLAMQDYNNWVSQLYQLASLGENAAAGQGNFQTQAGNALAGGAVGLGNALSGAFNQAQQYSMLQKLLGGGTAGNYTLANGFGSGADPGAGLYGMNPAGSGGRGITGYV